MIPWRVALEQSGMILYKLVIALEQVENNIFLCAPDLWHL